MLLQPHRLELGPVPANAVAMGLVWVENRGDGPLAVEVVGRCGVRVALEGGDLLLPGERTALRVAVRTGNVEGKFRGRVLVKTNEADRNVREVPVSLEVSAVRQSRPVF